MEQKLHIPCVRITRVLHSLLYEWLHVSLRLNPFNFIHFDSVRIRLFVVWQIEKYILNSKIYGKHYDIENLGIRKDNARDFCAKERGRRLKCSVRESRIRHR